MRLAGFWVLGLLLSILEPFPLGSSSTACTFCPARMNSRAGGRYTAVGAVQAAPDTFVSVAPEVQLYVHEIGSGSPVVVLHGGPGLDMNYIAEDLAPLGRSHRVIFYDQRGTGRSTLTKDVTANALVADLEALRQRLGFDQLTLLGHSWGAGLAALYATAHPGRVARLLLVDAMPPRAVYLSDFQRILMGRLSPDEQARLQAAERATRDASTDAERVASCESYWQILTKAYYADRNAARKSHARMCAAPPAALDNGWKINELVLHDLGNYDWRPGLATLNVPTLVIHGDRDPVPMDAAREWTEGLPDARLLVLPNSGHVSYVEQPGKFFDAVNGFLAGRWPGDAKKPSRRSRASARQADEGTARYR